MTRDRFPRAWLQVVGMGVVVGFLVGYLVAYSHRFFPSPLVLFDFLYLALFYGLGAAVVLVGRSGKSAFPSTAERHIFPFSVGFACAYYSGIFVYFLAAYMGRHQTMLPL